MGGGSACRPHAHSSPAFSDSYVAGWRRDPLSTSSPRFAAVLLLVTWLVGVLVVPTAGQSVHVLLLVGLALLLVAALRAREEAMRRTVEGHVDKK